MASGTLFLVPAWLSEGTSPEAILPAKALERLRALECFVVEDARSARRYVAACGHPKPMRELRFEELNEHTQATAVPALLAPLLEGRDVGLISEAGVPAVADPGGLGVGGRGAAVDAAGVVGQAHARRAARTRRQRDRVVVGEVP